MTNVVKLGPGSTPGAVLSFSLLESGGPSIEYNILYLEAHPVGQ